MKPETTEDILELMNSSIAAAAVSAAMELGLFWLLDRNPLPATEAAKFLGIPLNRCQAWLQILSRLGLLENIAGSYAVTTLTREMILKVQSQETWTFQAQEYRDSALLVQDLGLNITQPMEAWQSRRLPLPGYFQQMQEDPGYARRFTRKLYEIHRPLAKQVASLLDLRDVKNLMDLGGGSGVVSFELLRKQPALTAVVLDMDNVCRAGREIALAENLGKRITYRAVDFLEDELPAGFDLVLLCDVGSFSEDLFRKVYAALAPEGRLVIVDKFAPGRTSPPASRLAPAFLDSLQHPATSVDFITAEAVLNLLHQAGFAILSVTPVPHEDDLPWNLDWSLVEARK